MLQHYRGGVTVTTLLKQVRELRQKQTPAEAILWHLLRNKQLHGAKFRRQHQFGTYICDFYCHEARLVVELDGKYHDILEQKHKDSLRNQLITEQGVKVIRFKNEAVYESPAQVLEEISIHLPQPMIHKNEKNPSSHHPSPIGRGTEGEGQNT